MIDVISHKNKQYTKRRLRSKKHLKSSAERPRLIVTKTNKYIYAQVIDDSNHTVICSISSVSKEMADKKLGKDIESAKVLGTAIAKKLKSKKIDKVVFDRNGYQYHGKIKALADSCREGGIQF
ncbi:MAG: 50S ribosomal protein L18 [Spirochaetes bacterium GWF1_49_6]|nr:MAG: 50S ribosomal protein L18 [Spirochaetes bacterium GWF1_49_6]